MTKAITTKAQASAVGYLEETWDTSLGRPRCQATSKQRKEQCLKWPAKGNRVCYIHGARGGRPVIHGRYSKRLPARLAERYHESRNDPDMLALRDEIALVDTRTDELLGRLEGTGGDWERVTKALQSVRRAVLAQDAPAMLQGLTVIETEAQTGVREREAWDEVVALLEQRRRLVETERRRIVDARQILTVEEALALLAVTRDVIMRHVQDSSTRAAISHELRSLAEGRALAPRGGKGVR